MSSCNAALLTQAPLPAHCLLTVLFPCSIIMAEAAPAVPRQQRRKEARAQADEDVRRVRQRMDEADVRLDTLEGRLRGHDLRLQYLEVPLNVLKKFKARLSSGLPRILGSRRPNPPFRLHFFKSFVMLVVLLFSIFWKRLSRSWLNKIRMRSSEFSALGGSTQDRDGTIVPDAVLRLHPGDQGFRLGYLLSSIGRHLGEDRVVHTDRPRKHQGEKGKGKGKGKAQGKGKDKGFAQPKRAAGRMA